MTTFTWTIDEESQIIQAAYEAGFEPTSDTLLPADLYLEAIEYLTNSEVKN